MFCPTGLSSHLSKPSSPTSTGYPYPQDCPSHLRGTLVTWCWRHLCPHWNVPRSSSRWARSGWSLLFLCRHLCHSVSPPTGPCCHHWMETTVSPSSPCSSWNRKWSFIQLGVPWSPVWLKLSSPSSSPSPGNVPTSPCVP